MSNTLRKVVQDLEKQEAKGLRKYGTTLDANFTAIETLQHAYEEALDLCMYLRKTIDTYGTRRINEAKTEVGSAVGRSEKTDTTEIK